MFKLITHENQHGFGVSLVTHKSGEITNGFVLHSFDTKQERDEYMAGFQLIVAPVLPALEVEAW